MAKFELLSPGPCSHTPLDNLTIACHIVPRELLEVCGFKLLVVSVQCAHHSWPGLLKYLTVKNADLSQ